MKFREVSKVFGVSRKIEGCFNGVLSGLQVNLKEAHRKGSKKLGIQETRQIVDGKTKVMENNVKRSWP